MSAAIIGCLIGSGLAVATLNARTGSPLRAAVSLSCGTPLPGRQLNIQFDHSDAPGLSFSISYGDGHNATEGADPLAMLQHQYSRPGTYTVTATLAGKGGPTVAACSFAAID